MARPFHLAARPYGGWSVLLGKYLLAVTWTLQVGLIAATFGSIIGAESDVFQLV